MMNNQTARQVMIERRKLRDRTAREKKRYAVYQKAKLKVENKAQKIIKRALERVAQTRADRIAREILTSDTARFNINSNEFGARVFKKVRERIGDRQITLGTSNGKFRCLNYRNLNKIIESMEMENFGVEESAGDIHYLRAQNIVHSGVLTTERLVNPNELEIRLPWQGDDINGSFFKWFHNTDLDLSELQIFPKNEQLTAEDDSCFVHALKMSGQLTNVQLQSVRHKHITREMSQKKIKEIAESMGLYITVRRPEANGQLRKYGIKNDNPIKLGLIEKHYFIIKKIDVSSYALKNYESIRDLPDWNRIVKRRANGTYMNSNARQIESYEVVKILLENKDALLTEIPLDELYHTLYYKTTPQIEHLEYNDELCLREKSAAQCSGYITEEQAELLNKEQEQKDAEVCPKQPTAKKAGSRRKRRKIRATVKVFFDFETTTDSKIHIPYLVRCSQLKKTFCGPTCGLEMMKALSDKFPDKDLFLVAHNLGYDWRFLEKYLSNISLIERGTSLMRGSGVFRHPNKAQVEHRITVQDSYSFLSCKLSKFGEMFKLPIEKEILPYSIYTNANVDKRYLPLDIVLDNREMFNKKEFEAKLRETGCVDKNDIVDIIKYSAYYCKRDVEVLEKGYNKFAEWMLEVANLDINNFCSAAQLANCVLDNDGVYEDVPQVALHVREFIQRSMVGGRTMSCENMMWWIKETLADFDAVSLYPSAQHRLGGYLKGKPKVLNTTQYEDIKNYDGYFIEIKITKVGKNRKFPLMSRITNTGGRLWTNDMVGRTMHVDKTSLEDLIEFQKVEFEIIRGYYYDEGRNLNLKTVVRKIFEERKRYKKEGNPIEQTFKLLLNSPYGKTLLKPIENEVKYLDFHGETPEKIKGETNKYIAKYYNSVIEFSDMSETRKKVKLAKQIDKHFNHAHCGVEVLSMSKRIMNEVMCLAEDNDIDIYYQDTDSMHIKDAEVKKLAQLFHKKYGRELIGKELGQFHGDFNSDILQGNIVSREAIFLGKKAYLDVLVSDDSPNVEDFHVRLKGIPDTAFKYYCKQHDLTPFQVYEKLYNGEELTFDLVCDGTVPRFMYNKDGSVSSKTLFKRRVKFGKK